MTDRETQLENEKKEALAALDDVRTPEGLEAWRIAHLGKSSPVMQAFSDLGKLPAEERPLVGRAANTVKQALEGAYAVKSEQLRNIYGHADSGAMRTPSKRPEYSQGPNPHLC